ACRLSELDVVECARDAVLRALPERVAGSGAADPGGALPATLDIALVLEPRAASSFIAALAPAASSGGFPEVRRPSALPLADDPAVPRCPSSAPFDGAGRPGGRRILVEGGRASGRLDDARRHVIRSSYRDLPVPGLAALVVAPGVKVADPAAALGV